MKNLYLSVFLVLFPLLSGMAQVGINTNNSEPDASAMLDVSSIEKGFLLPRMTNTQRNAIPNPATGLLVYQTDSLSGFYFYEGASWTYLIEESKHATIQDLDQDTKIQVEKNPDEDIIRFDVAGTEVMRHDGQSLEMLNIGQSVFIGEGAGANDDGTNNKNTFVGFEAGMHTSTGEQNTAAGHRALYHNTEGIANTAFGHQALYKNTEGDFNIASGYQSLYNNTTGEYNTATGYQALYNNTQGVGNIAIGRFSLYLNTDGNYNIALGKNALYKNLSGDDNIAIGDSALYTNINGSQNIAIGYHADVTNSNLNNAAAIGNHAKVNCSNCLVLGAESISTVNVGIGTTNPTEKLDIDGSIRIRGGSPARGKVLTATSSDGSATWIHPKSNIKFKEGNNDDYDNTDIWRDIPVNNPINYNADIADVFVLYARTTAKLMDGSGSDPFEFRFKITGCGSPVYTEIIRYEPNHLASDHNNRKSISYLDYWEATCSGSLNFIFQMRNTGDEAWLQEFTEVVVKKY